MLIESNYSDIMCKKGDKGINADKGMSRMLIVYDDIYSNEV
jgi:hypothetical protein